MKSFQRKLIWTATFIFGAIWILAFFLPSEVGGGVDRHGMYAPDLVGTRLFYSSGSRQISAPLNEHKQGSYICQLDLTAVNRRETAFRSSPFRRDDYFGAKRPSVFQVEEGWVMLYLGLGKDDRKRVCMAKSNDSISWRPENIAVFDPPRESAPEGVLWFSVYDEGLGYRLYYGVMRRARIVVRQAFSEDLINWKDEGEFLELPEPESVLSLSPMKDGKFLIVSKLHEKNPFVSISFVHDGVAKDRVFVGGEEINVPEGVEIGEKYVKADFAQVIVDARVKEDTGFMRVLIVGGEDVNQFGENREGVLRLGILEGTDLSSLQPIQGSLPDGSVAELSAPAFSTGFSSIAGKMSDFVPIVMTFGFVMGLISLVMVHGRRIKQGGETRWFSLLAVLALIVMVIIQFGNRTTQNHPVWTALDDLFFMRMQFPLGATMFGLLAAYLVSAAYRAFRIRTFDAAVLTAVAALVVITQVPMGQFIVSLFSPESAQAGAAFDAIATEPRTWALNVANDAVQRAVGFGAFVGAVAIALRLWLSLDKTSFE